MKWLNWTSGVLPGREFFGSGRFWVPTTIIVAIAVGVVSFLWWDRLNVITEVRTEELGTDVTTIRTETVESASTTIRNVGLVLGGIVAIMLAMWRSLVAQRQADATLRQASAAFLQAKTAERESTTTLRSFLNERYEQGCSRLESDDHAVRLDGIDMLERIAREHPRECHVQVVKRLSSFVQTRRSSFIDISDDDRNRTRVEIRTAMEAIGSRSEEDVRLESNESFELNLSGSNLQSSYLANLNLSGSNLINANLSGARLLGVDLSNARLQGAYLTDALLSEANLSGTQFSFGDGDYPAVGLTQPQIDSAHAYRDNPPKLEGVLDAKGEQLNPPTTEPGWWDEIRGLARASEQGEPDSPREES